MSHKEVVVVVRHLSGCKPVVDRAVLIPAESTSSARAIFAGSVCEDAKVEASNNFIEFEKAGWYYYILPLGEYDVK